MRACWLKWVGRDWSISADYIWLNYSDANNQMPFNYEDRLIPLKIGARFIRYFTPSLEDLAVMKLYAYRPNDIVDLHSQAFVDRLDWDLLERLIFDEGEALASSPSERSYQEMVCAYRQYKKEVLG